MPERRSGLLQNVDAPVSRFPLDPVQPIRYARTKPFYKKAGNYAMSSSRNNLPDGGVYSEPPQRPIIPLPADTFEDRQVAILHYRRMHHWLDEAFEECKRNGGFDHLPGKGKPVEVPTEDVLQTILKNAKVPPPWIMLRKDIQESIEYTLELLRTHPDEPSIDAHIKDINKKITQLNIQSPSLSLHRRKVTRETLEAEFEKWK
ncbi:DUF1992 domain-containing protein [Paenibacillus sp. GCM10012303]|uniref:DnaJ family domain-containing protein n=1 Tax=Paenibacillus sp. GCM10012303 TaxID=3317340 RepID=UPI003619E2E5